MFFKKHLLEVVFPFQTKTAFPVNCHQECKSTNAVLGGQVDCWPTKCDIKANSAQLKLSPAKTATWAELGKILC